MITDVWFWGDPRELQLLHEAGAELSAWGASPGSLSFFGLRWSELENRRSVLEKIPLWGLPTFMSPSAEVLRDNEHLISMLYPRAEGIPYRRLCMAYDRTYLLSTWQLLRTNIGNWLVGGAHRPSGFQAEDESYFVLQREKGEKQYHIKNCTKANELEAFVCWDSTRIASPTMELASFPCTSSATRHAEFEAGMKDTSHQRGKFENLHRLGFVLDAARSVRFLLADSHASHEWSHRLFLGQTIELPDAFLSEMVFWKDLTFHPLPRTKHHLDYRLVKVSGEHFGYLPGVAHIQKNAVEQLRSSLRTVHFGKLPCDGSAMLALGMWPASYIGSDTMSDQQAALWSLECVSSIWFLWIMDLVVFLLPDDPKEILVVTCQCFECFETIQLRPFERFP